MAWQTVLKTAKVNPDAGSTPVASALSAPNKRNKVSFIDDVAANDGDWESTLAEHGVDYWSHLVDEVWDTSRWSIFYRKVYQIGDKFYEIIHEEGATEYQEGGDFGPPEVNEVYPTTKTVVVYQRAANTLPA